MPELFPGGFQHISEAMEGSKKSRSLNGSDEHVYSIPCPYVTLVP